MTDQLWDAMVMLARRSKARRLKPNVIEVQEVSLRRRQRPTTLRSVRATLVDDHYAMLAEGNY